MKRVKLSLFLVFSGQNMAIWPPLSVILSENSYFLWIHVDINNVLGVLGPRYGHLTCVSGFILKKYFDVLINVPYCGCSASFNGLNLGFISKRPILLVYFGQNSGIWPPRVVGYREATYCLVTFFMKFNDASFLIWFWGYFV